MKITVKESSNLSQTCSKVHAWAFQIFSARRKGMRCQAFAWGAERRPRAREREKTSECGRKEKGLKLEGWVGVREAKGGGALVRRALVRRA